jgi:hypothetical protein
MIGLGFRLFEKAKIGDRIVQRAGLGRQRVAVDVISQNPFQGRAGPGMAELFQSTTSNKEQKRERKQKRKFEQKNAALCNEKTTKAELRVKTSKLNVAIANEKKHSQLEEICEKD